MSEKKYDHTKKWKEMSYIWKDLEKDGLEIKECAFGESRCEFIKGKDLEEKILKNLHKLTDKINKCLSLTINPESKTALQEIYEQFYSFGMIKKAIRVEGDKKKVIRRLLSYEVEAKIHRCNCGRSHEEEERGHKKEYDIDKIKHFDSSFYYVINISRSMSKNYIYLILIIAGVILYNTMSIWPYTMKYYVWKTSYSLLIGIIVLYIVRLGVFLFFYIFGFSVWIFPDMNDEKLGPIESFKRVISYEKTQDIVWYKIVIRLGITGSVLYVVYSVYMHPEIIDEGKKLIVDAVKDLYTYGEDRLVNGNSTAISAKHKYKTLDEIYGL